MLVLYATFLLNKTIDEISNPFVPALVCKIQKQCKKNDFKHQFFTGNYRHMSIENLKARIYGCRCRFTIDTVTCHSRWIMPDIKNNEKKSDAESSSQSCRKLCLYRKFLKSDLHYLVDEPECSPWKAVVGEHLVVRFSDDIVGYDPKIMIRSNVKPKISSVAPFAANLTEVDILYNADSILTHSSQVSVISDESKDMRFVKTTSTNCELVLLYANNWLFTGNNIYYNEDYYTELVSLIPEILTFPTEMDDPGFKALPKAINLFLKSSEREISVMCDRMEADNICRFLPSRPSGVSDECLQKAAQRGVIFGKDLSTNKTMAAQCNVEKKMTSMTEILSKQNVSYHGKDYWLVQAKTYMENIVLGINLQIFYPKVMTLARGDQLALYSTNITDVGEYHFFDAINITDRDKENPLPILPGRKIHEMYAKDTMSRLGDLYQQLKSSILFWVVTVLAGWILVGTCLSKVLGAFCKCDCQMCREKNKTSCCKGNSCKEKVTENKEENNATARSSIATETDVEDLLNRLSREYDSLMTPNTTLQSRV